MVLEDLQQPASNSVVVYFHRAQGWVEFRRLNGRRPLYYFVFRPQQATEYYGEL